MEIVYRNASPEDVPAVYALQQKYHIATIREIDKPDGFVDRPLFTQAQLKELIERKRDRRRP